MKKKVIRQLYKEKRKSLSKEQLKLASEAIYQNAVTQFQLEGKQISIFLPIERFLEIDTWLFINQVKSTYYLPVIQGENDLVHIRYEGKEQLEISDWGIPEPTYGETADVKVLDIVFVPLLAIDQKGYRVGYGKGFYDRFLSQCRPDCLFIGLNYFEPITAIEDTFEGDIPLHYCVSPQGVIGF